MSNLFAPLAAVGLIFSLIAAWLTHVIVCIKTGSWLFLIAGAIAAPVGVIHGVGVWFGAW
ncbi:hypothetical protein [Phenylobacterium sp.]|uniref:hypothetical protein n=1 Tax=Phenylobacterium sp. TaxID=1871053 RepID=UPI002730E0D2|nr:hypothetical protein [Phenylobacterium sp.]MDP1873671.1 hypothetical protein [Phenylobacterium sp.]